MSEAEIAALRAGLQEAESAMYSDVAAVRERIAAVLAGAPGGAEGGRLRVHALTLRAILLAQAGDGVAAIRISLPQLEAARELGAADLEARLQNVLGATYDLLDQPERALHHFDRCIALAEGLGDELLVEKARMNTGVALSRMGEDARAVERYGAVVASMEAGGRGEQAARAFLNLAVSQFRLGRLEEARVSIGRARTCLAVAGHARTEAHVESLEADLAREEGAPGRALAHLQRAVELAVAHQLGAIEVRSRCEAAELLLARDPPPLAEARAHAVRALELGRGIPGEEQHETALRVMAALLEAEGRLAEALEMERERFSLAESRWRAHSASQIATLRVEHEVASLRREQEVLATRNRQLQALAESRGDGLATASHDLRSPLLVLSLISETLTARSPAQLEGAAGQINQTVQRMTDILDRVLAADDGPVAWVSGRVRTMDLERAVAGVARRYRPIASRKGQVLRLSRGGAKCVSANAGALDQILTNLVDNAIKYAPPETAIDIHCDSDGVMAWVDVLDRGPGLSEDDLQRVFGRFARLSAKPSGGEASHGLGLYVVRRLVEAMGGVADAGPREGGGARFRITLPVGGGTDGAGCPPVDPGG